MKFGQSIPRVLLLITTLACAGVSGPVLRPVATYSIVACDPNTGQMGVAVQSHWFSVGTVVCWAEAGVGSIATQSFVEVSYGPLGLALLRAGKSPAQALKGLLATDSHAQVRQVAMVDALGRVAVHTGDKCIREAGHKSGKGYSCQANMMVRSTVPAAMAAAFESAGGPFVDRLLAALEAAQAEKGDIRGKQSAALIVVDTKPSKVAWQGRIFDLRVEDHASPLVELRRLVTIAKAYNFMNRGDEHLTRNELESALKAYNRAMEIYPKNPEMIFWPAVLLASQGRVEESLPLFRRVFREDANWMELLRRLPAAGQFPENPALLKRILSEGK